MSGTTNNSTLSKRKTIDHSHDHDDHARDHELVVTASMSDDPNDRFVTATTITTTNTMENGDTAVDEHQHNKHCNHKKRRSGDRNTDKDSEVDPDVPPAVVVEDPMKGLQSMSFPVKLHLLLETYEKERKERQQKKEEETLELELTQKAIIIDNNKDEEEEDDTATINTLATATSHQTTESCTSCKQKILKSVPIIEWHANGKSFKIHDETRFVTELIPRYCTSCSSSLHSPVPPSARLSSTRSRSQSRSSSLETEQDGHGHEHTHEHEHHHEHGHHHEQEHDGLEQLQPSFHNFERNLNLWGFNYMLRVEGPYQQRCTIDGSIRSMTRKVHLCSHPLFRKEERELCKTIKFIGDRFISSDGSMNTTSTRKSSSHKSSSSSVAVASSLCLAIINTKNVL